MDLTLNSLNTHIVLMSKRIVGISLPCSTICNSGMGSPALVTYINTLRALILPFNLHIFPYNTFLLSSGCCTVVRYIGEASYSLPHICHCISICQRRNLTPYWEFTRSL